MQGQVKYVNRGVEHFGTYKVDGRMLELTCRHGTRRAVLGLFEAKALARKLLKFLVTKAERETMVRAPRPAPYHTAAQKVTARVSRPDQPKSSAAWARITAIQVETEAKRGAAGGIAASPMP